ncbi:MAG: isoprenyl transferase [Hyphomicrobiaceae bacterium]
MNTQDAAFCGEPVRSPRHVAIIMDGNGRWAAERGFPRGEGHRRGVEAVKRAVRAAIELGIPTLTIFSFSSENWNRPRTEIDDLMGLMKHFIRRDLDELHREGVRIRVIGTTEGVDPELVRLIEDAKRRTAANSRMDLVIAFNYGSRAEIAATARRLAERVEAGTLKPSDITVDSFGASLDTAGIPDPDLLIRTSGELRLSNFMLWQCAYSELVFLEIYWPEFTRAHLEEAVRTFHGRQRRFGGLSTQVAR